jgi:hypothetical protein
MPTPSANGGDNFIGQMERSAGRVAAAPSDSQGDALEREVATYPSGQQAYVRSQLGLFVAKLKSERNEKPSPKQIFGLLAISVLFVIVLVSIAIALTHFVPSFITALAIECALLFAILLTVVSVALPSPTNFQYAVFRTYLAIAAAGVGSGIPGLIEVHSQTASFGISAAGALALFVIVYFFGPASQKRNADQNSDH